MKEIDFEKFVEVLKNGMSKAGYHEMADVIDAAADMAIRNSNYEQLPKNGIIENSPFFTIGDCVVVKQSLNNEPHIIKNISAGYDYNTKNNLVLFLLDDNSEYPVESIRFWGIEDAKPGMILTTFGRENNNEWIYVFDHYDKTSNRIFTKECFNIITKELVSRESIKLNVMCGTKPASYDDQLNFKQIIEDMKPESATEEETVEPVPSFESDNNQDDYKLGDVIVTVGSSKKFYEIVEIVTNPDKTSTYGICLNNIDVYDTESNPNEIINVSEYDFKKTYRHADITDIKPGSIVRTVSGKITIIDKIDTKSGRLVLYTSGDCDAMMEPAEKTFMMSEQEYSESEIAGLANRDEIHLMRLALINACHYYNLDENEYKYLGPEFSKIYNHRWYVDENGMPLELMYVNSISEDCDVILRYQDGRKYVTDYNHGFRKLDTWSIAEAVTGNILTARDTNRKQHTFVFKSYETVNGETSVSSLVSIVNSSENRLSVMTYNIINGTIVRPATCEEIHSFETKLKLIDCHMEDEWLVSENIPDSPIMFGDLFIVYGKDGVCEEVGNIIELGETGIYIDSHKSDDHFKYIPYHKNIVRWTPEDISYDDVIKVKIKDKCYFETGLKSYVDSGFYNVDAEIAFTEDGKLIDPKTIKVINAPACLFTLANPEEKRNMEVLMLNYGYKYAPEHDSIVSTVSENSTKIVREIDDNIKGDTIELIVHSLYNEFNKVRKLKKWQQND